MKNSQKWREWIYWSIKIRFNDKLLKLSERNSSTIPVDIPNDMKNWKNLKKIHVMCKFKPTRKNKHFWQKGVAIWHAKCYVCTIWHANECPASFCTSNMWWVKCIPHIIRKEGYLNINIPTNWIHNMTPSAKRTHNIFNLGENRMKQLQRRPIWIYNRFANKILWHVRGKW